MSIESLRKKPRTWDLRYWSSPSLPSVSHFRRTYLIPISYDFSYTFTSSDCFKFKFYWPDVYNMKHLFVEVFLQIFIVHIFLFSSFLSKANQLRWLLICYKWADMAALVLKHWRTESIKSLKKKDTCWYKITTKKWFLSRLMELLLIRDKMKAWWQEWKETGEIGSCPFIV